ncbi:hypothetical protein [Bradyrhizobium sp. 6(2017)]|uniref:hypothetical protein n=1 Tax=Bradyrhizobium sp. 6(2017) TaxID=1197460 RepID=UPI0013E1111D|nr:hypothetical protein [Bradyrhizobium sp. 6(2017)]QIG95555.1 hypothetical protein G6P99_26235 [Bradyrhizobium sp. 6(2017)]
MSKARATSEVAVATCSLTRDGYADALAEVQTKIALSEQTLVAERPAVERKAASRRKCRRVQPAVERKAASRRKCRRVQPTDLS